ncbi:hypothetical protein BDR07DRAFT_1412269 [Suillus spraguei]|nr:hypothetical protein BDR07DRAFT_1412269 [Suillus spraguei]
MSFTTPIQTAYPCSHHPLPFSLDPHAPQYNRKRRERAPALYLKRNLRNRPTPNALHAQGRDKSPNQTRVMPDVLRTRMPEANFDFQFPFDSDRARQQAELQTRRAIRDQAIREHEATTQEWHNFAAFQAHLEEQRLSARHRLEENFLAKTTSPVPAQDKPSFKDMISSYLMEQRRLMEEYQFQVHDALQEILSHLSKITATKASTELKRHPATSLTATSTSVNVNEKSSQEGKGEAEEITGSDIQEEPAASLAQVVSSLSEILSVTTRLDGLLAAFQFPAELDFSPALGNADVFALPYTPANAPVRAQEHALSLLFADLDNIPSFGSDVVRNAKRAVVTRVGQALEELDKGVEERRDRARAKKADLVITPIEAPICSSK